MARTVMLGNGSLTVGLDENGLVHDFYYPYVGLDNLTTSRGAHHKIGVWIDGNFSWVDGDQWVNSIDSESDAMVSKIIMQNKDHGIELIFNDYVDHSTNAFVRRINVINQTEHHKSVRIFMHQIFQISRAGRADTALYVPDDGYILDYKGRCCLLISGKTESGQVFDQFAIGNYGIEGKEGTYKDAEDGELSGSPVEHGGVDSVIRFSFELNANEHTYLNYWVIAADSEYQAAKHHDKLVEQDLNDRLEANRKYWHEWLASASNLLHEVDKKYLDMTKKSLLVIKAHIDKRGGIIASCDSSIYNYGRDYYSYVWPRDGAYAIWPLIRLGYKSEAKKFFEFCRDILTEEGYLMHKYQPDRAIGSTWHPLLHGRRKELAIQEDETAGVLYMLGEYHKYSNDDEFVQSLYETFIKPAANFIVDFTDKETSLPHASYDLWEEKFLCTTYSTAVSYQALLVAAEFAEKFEYPDDALRWEEKAEEILDNSDVFFNQNEGYFRKGFLLKEDGSLEFDNTLDVSSFYGVMVYGLYKDSLQIKSTEENLEKILLNVSPSGGSARYIGDNYFKVNDSYPGNPWIITTLWFAQYYARTKQPDKAREILDWTMSVTLSSGVLPEQINPDTKAPVSVTPLVWSHAEFINTVLDLTQIAE